MESMEKEAKPIKTTRVGELFELCVRENLSTGYQTVARFDEKALELMGDLTEAQASEAFGADHQKVFQFKALREGDTEVAIWSCRAWDATQGSETERLLIRVEGALPQNAA